MPIVPAAILFDLLNGGDKAWGRYPPYRDLGYAAALAAARDFALGSVGAGTGAGTANLKGGLGSASAHVADLPVRVGALVAVNAFGRVTIGEGPSFLGRPTRRTASSAAWDRPPRCRTTPSPGRARARRGGCRCEHHRGRVATDAVLTKAQARRLAVMAQDGLARAIHPVHTPLDGDVVFAVSTGRTALADPATDLARIGDAAAGRSPARLAIGVCFPRPPCRISRGPPAWRDASGRDGRLRRQPAPAPIPGPRPGGPRVPAPVEEEEFEAGHPRRPRRRNSAAPR